MLTAKALVNAYQAAVYYERDDYYVDGRQLSPSRWYGEGAHRLGLRGEVDRRVFAELLHGRLPNGGVIAAGGDGTHRPGTDFTFSAPKSVSLLGLVAGDERVLRAHDEAVTIALKHLEMAGARARTRDSRGVHILQADNLVVARFNHDTSRAADPQLHTHAVVMNITQREDGEWKALFNREIYRHMRAAGAIYRAELAGELRRLGYTVERTHADGRFEIAGISKEAIEAFSTRRAAIEKYLDERGLEGVRAADVAARATRDAKQDLPREALRASWKARAAELGVDFDQVRSRTRPLDLGERRVAADKALDHAVENLMERKVIASERQLIQHALAFGVGEIRLDDLARAFDRKLARKELVPAISSRQPDPFSRDFTTDQALTVEKDLLHLLKRSRGAGRAICDAREIDRAINAIETKGPFALTEDQANAIAHVLTADDRVTGIQGYAGTGKTTGVLLHVRRIAEAQGLEVRGFAPSAVAAELLEKDAGIPSMTLARFLNAVRRGDVPSGPQIWILDEASMMGNGAARDFLEAADRAGARVVLVGDRDQLPSIEAGRAFGLLMDHGLKVAELEQIIRQKDQKLRKAVAQTIARNHEGALEAVRPRIRAVPNRDQRIRELVDAYFDAPDDLRRETLILTPTNKDRRAINELVRRGLRERNLLGEQHAMAFNLTSKNLTAAQKRDPLEYEPNTVVRFQRRYKSLGIEKGEYFIVKNVDRKTGLVTLYDNQRSFTWKPERLSKVEAFHLERRELRAGDRIRWTRNDHDRDRINASTATVIRVDPEQRTAEVLVKGNIQQLDLRNAHHFDHAYASTIHAAQGRTADRVLLHLDSQQSHLLGHESWYVGISRARKDIRIFTDRLKALPSEIKKSLSQEEALRAVGLERVKEREANEHRHQYPVLGFGR